jgi:hypothetical protein
MLSTLLTVVLPALLPVFADGAKAVINKVTGGAGAQPGNFQEAMELARFDLEKLKTLAELDRPSGNTSQWVADLRGSARYLSVGIILVIWGIVTIVDLFTTFKLEAVAYTLVADMATSAFFFLFGDRVYMGIKNRRG